MIEKGEPATSVEEKKRVKTQLIYLDDAGNNELQHFIGCFYLWRVG